jgi:plasmid stability protein
MPTLVIKDLPVELHKRLKKEAEKTHRSMTKEAIYLLETALQQEQPKAMELPVPYKGVKPITDKMIQKWKRQGMA